MNGKEKAYNLIFDRLKAHRCMVSMSHGYRGESADE